MTISAPGAKRGVDAAGGVGQDQGLDARGGRARAIGERHRAQVVPFVEMRAPASAATRLPAQRADHQPPRVADHGRRRPVRDLAVRRRHAHRSAPSAKSPSPEPSTIATSGAPNARARLMPRASTLSNIVHVQRVLTAASAAIAGVDQRREEAAEQGARAEPRQVAAPRRRHRADAAELDADRRDVGEAGQGVGRQHVGRSADDVAVLASVSLT